MLRIRLKHISPACDCPGGDLAHPTHTLACSASSTAGLLQRYEGSQLGSQLAEWFKDQAGFAVWIAQRPPRTLTLRPTKGNVVGAVALAAPYPV